MDTAEFKTKTFYFGQKPLIVFLAFLNAFVPLSLDLYLPALPSMVDFFGTSKQAVNLTLSLFMLCFGASMLFWGPLSDRLGRRKILYTGFFLYLSGSLLCVFAWDIVSLIVGRVIQAAGCGALQSVSMAIVKDIFSGRTMENVLVWIQTMTVLCPMLAPLLGAFMLKFISWHGLFWFLFGGGVIGMFISLALRETLREPTNTSVLRSFSRIAFVLKDKGLRVLLLLFAFTAMPFMAYLGSSAFIYEHMFGTTSQVFSYFFAANAACSMLAPIVYIRLFREFPRYAFLTVAFCMIGVCGFMLLIFGDTGPYVFFLFFSLISFMGSAIRPVGTLLIMSQLDSDNGTVASLMSCSTLLLGSLAMFFCSLWDNPVLAVGATCMTVGLICLCQWVYINRVRVYREP